MFQDYIEENRKNVIVHLLEIKRIKRENNIVKIQDGIYSHTNMKEKTKYYIVTNLYKEYERISNDYANHKLHKVMGLYIIEVEQLKCM